MKKALKKSVSILLSLIMVFSVFAIVPISSASAAENAFVKVTSEPTDWSGEYLVVYEVNNEPNKVFNSAANLSTGANTLQAAFGVSDGNIDYDGTTAAAAVTIEKIEDTEYYSIKVASGKYIGKSDDTNGIDESVSALYNTIAWDNGSVKITSAGGAIMRYNTGSSQFRYYRTTSYTNQQPIQLYKLTAVESEPEPEPAVGTIYNSGEHDVSELNTGDYIVCGVESFMDSGCEYTVTLKAGTYADWPAGETAYDEGFTADSGMFEVGTDDGILYFDDWTNGYHFMPFVDDAIGNAFYVESADHDAKTITLSGANAPAPTEAPTEAPDVIKDCTYQNSDTENVYANVPFIIGENYSEFPNGAILTDTDPDDNQKILVYDAKGYSYKLYDKTGTEIPATLSGTSLIAGSDLGLSDDVTIYMKAFDPTYPEGFDPSINEIYIVATVPLPDVIKDCTYKSPEWEVYANVPLISFLNLDTEIASGNPYIAYGDPEADDGHVVIGYSAKDYNYKFYDKSGNEIIPVGSHRNVTTGSEIEGLGVDKVYTFQYDLGQIYTPLYVVATGLPEVIKDCTYQSSEYPAYANVPFIIGDDYSEFTNGAIIIGSGGASGIDRLYDAKGYSYRFYDRTGTEIAATISSEQSMPGSKVGLSDDVTVYVKVFDFTLPENWEALYIVATAPAESDDKFVRAQNYEEVYYAASYTKEQAVEWATAHLDELKAERSAAGDKNLWIVYNVNVGMNYAEYIVLDKTGNLVTDGEFDYPLTAILSFMIDDGDIIYYAPTVLLENAEALYLFDYYDVDEEEFAAEHTGTNVKITPSADNIEVSAGWEFKSSVSANISALNGKNITKIEVTTTKPSRVKMTVDGSVVSGTAVGNVVTYDNINATEAVLTSESSKHIVSKIVVYYTDGEPAPTTYTVTWKNGDGTTLKTDTVDKDTAPAYSGNVPEKAEDENFTYYFSGWTDGENTYAADAELPAVTGDVTYTAVFDGTAKHEAGYYVVGTMTEWKIDDAYLLTKNEPAEGDEFMLNGVAFTSTDAIKVVKYEPGNWTWYPDGEGNDYAITADGTYDIYFRPNADGGDDWFYNCIYVVAPAVEPTEPVAEPTTAPTEPATPDEPTTAVEPTEVPIAGAPAYYVVGTFTDWQINDAYQLEKNDAADGEEYVFEFLGLSTTTEFKVVSFNASIEGGDMTWYPDGTGNNYGQNGEITEEGTYTLYFRPNGDGGDDWFYNCIYVSASEVEPADPSEVVEPTYEPIVGASTYYVVGSFTDWQTDDAFILTRNDESEGEYMITGVELKASDEFKVVETNGSILGFEPVWYPGGADSNYAIASDGVYDIYFRPNYDGGDDWFYNCIYVVAPEVEPTEPVAEPTTAPTEPTTAPTEPATPDEPTTAVEPTEVPIADAPAYYVVGTFTDWQIDDAYQLEKNDAADGEEYVFEFLGLSTTTEFKVVSFNASIEGGDMTWYPDGTGNNYGQNGEITEEGTYTLYFRPNGDGGDDWFYNCIYVVAPEVEPTEPTTAPTEPATPDEPTTAVEPTEVPDLTDAVVAWVFDAEGKTAGEKLTEYGNGDDGYAATIGSGTLTLSVDGENGRALEWSDEEYGESGEDIVPILAAGKKNLWGSPYILMAFDQPTQAGYTFTISLAGSNKAPAEWQLSSSTDGETFTPVEGASFTLSADNRKLLTPYLDSVVIPEGTVCLKLTPTSTVTVAGGDYTESPTGGEIAINNILIAVPVPEPVEESYIVGDADGNGKVTIIDATTIQRVLISLPVDAGYNEKAAAYSTGKLSILDATYIQRWLAGIPVDYPIGQPAE